MFFSYNSYRRVSYGLQKEAYGTKGKVEHMCNLSDGVEQKGIEKGIEKGTLITLCSLVRDNLLEIEEAAKRANMTVAEFREELNK